MFHYLHIQASMLLFLNHPTSRFNPSGQPSSRSRHRNSAYGFAPVDPNLHLDIPGPVDEWGLVMVNLVNLGSAEFDVRKIFGFPKGVRKSVDFCCVFFLVAAGLRFINKKGEKSPFFGQFFHNEIEGEGVKPV